LLVKIEAKQHAHAERRSPPPLLLLVVYSFLKRRANTGVLILEFQLRKHRRALFILPAVITAPGKKGI